MTDTELYSMFITLGPIVSAKIMRDKSSGYSFGYGFVQYESPADAAKAIQQLNGLQVANNKRIKVSMLLTKYSNLVGWVFSNVKPFVSIRFCIFINCL